MANKNQTTRALITFFVLAFGISWITAFILQVVAQQSGLENFLVLTSMTDTTFEIFSDPPEGLTLPIPVILILTRILKFGPTLAAIITAAWLGDLPALMKKQFKWNVGIECYIFALLAPLGLLSLATILHISIFDTEVTGINWQGMNTILRLLMWVFLARFLFGGGLGEELGWRGFALDPMESRFGVVWASLIIGLIWTVWHLPAHLASDNFIVQLVAQLLYTVPLSLVFSWLYHRNNGSILIASLFHGAWNGMNAFFEYDLFPPLHNEDEWVMIIIFLLIIAGVLAGFALKKDSPLEAETI